MGGIGRLILLVLFWSKAAGAVSSAVVLAMENNALVAVLVGRINNQTVNALIVRLGNVQGETTQLNATNEGSCEFALHTLTTKYSLMENQMKVLQMTIDKQARLLQIKNKRLEDIGNIAQAIRIRQFKLAEEMLIGMDMMDIPKIVQDVYGNSENNFYLLVDFGRGLASLIHSFHVMKSLYSEVSINGIKDTSKLIVLAEAFKGKIVILHNGPSAIKAEAVTLFNTLIDSIRIKAVRFFVEAMKSNHYQKNAEVNSLAAAMYHLSPELSDIVMQSIVESAYESLEPNRILANVLSHSNTLQIIPAISKLFWNIKIFGNFNDPFVISLASNLSKLKDRNDFPNLSQQWKDAYDKMVENLPTCAKNLFFAPYVCLWNKDRNSYLHAAETSFNDIEARRYIFTSPATENMPTGAAWFVEKHGDKIMFKSTKYLNEYMYVAYDYDAKMRYVFNWIPGNNTDDQSAFQIELDGDHCYLRGMYYIEYLFASDVKFKDSNYTYAFTWKDGTTHGQSGFMWQIRRCVI